jgi:hypothetical protein
VVIAYKNRLQIVQSNATNWHTHCTDRTTLITHAYNTPHTLYTLRYKMDAFNFVLESSTEGRPANELRALGAWLGLLGVNRDQARSSSARLNRAKSENLNDFRDRAETSNQESEPRPSTQSRFSACLGLARISRKSLCITQSAHGVMI